MPHIFDNMQHCWKHYITHPCHHQSSQFHLFLFKYKQMYWLYTEIVKFHLEVHQWKSLKKNCSRAMIFSLFVEDQNYSNLWPENVCLYLHVVTESFKVKLFPPDIHTFIQPKKSFSLDCLLGTVPCPCVCWGFTRSRFGHSLQPHLRKPIYHMTE